MTRCPHCKLPMTENEKSSGACPACGARLGPAPATGDPAVQAAGVYQTVLDVAPGSVIVLHRQALLRWIALAALLVCLVAPFFANVRNQPTDPSVGAILAGGAIGVLTAATLFPRMLGNPLRGAVAWILGGLTAVGVILGSPTIGLLTFAAAGVIFAIGVWLVEASGRTVRIGPEGIERNGTWPWPRSTILRWDAVETLTADLKTIRTAQFGRVLGVISQSRLRLRGGGRSWTFSTSFYPGLAGVDHVILGYGRPAALRWTMAAVEEAGVARLGCVRLHRDRIGWRRVSEGATAGLSLSEHLFFTAISLGIYGLYFLARLARGWEEIPLEALRQVELIAGELVLEGLGGRRAIPMASIANGPYLVEMIRFLQATPAILRNDRAFISS